MEGQRVPAKGGEAPGRVRSSPGRRTADGPAQSLRRPARKFRDCGYLENRLPRGVVPATDRVVRQHATSYARTASNACPENAPACRILVARAYIQPTILKRKRVEVGVMTTLRDSVRFRAG